MHHDTHVCHMCVYVLLTLQVVDMYIHTGSGRVDRNRVRKGKDYCVMRYDIHIFHMCKDVSLTLHVVHLYTHTGPDRVDGNRARKGKNYGGTNGTNGDQVLNKCHSSGKPRGAP